MECIVFKPNERLTSPFSIMPLSVYQIFLNKMELEQEYKDLYSYYESFQKYNQKIQKLVNVYFKKGLIVPSQKKEIKNYQVPRFYITDQKKNIISSIPIQWNFQSQYYYSFYQYYYKYYYTLLSEIDELKSNIKQIHKFLKKETKMYQQLYVIIQNLKI